MKKENRVNIYLKYFLERIKNEKLRYGILQALPFWVASLITGVIAVLYSRLFASAEHISAYLLKHTGWWFIAITPMLFLLSYFIVRRFAPYARGSGIPQVLASLEIANPKEQDKVRNLLSIKVIIVKIISTLTVAIGGGVIGREGPTIQIAGSVFRKINQWIPANWPKISRRNMIMTGAAAGLAAAFNTPLGGIVFAIEELTRTHLSYFRTAIFTSVIIAGLTAQHFLGSYLYLGYPDVNGLSGGVFLIVVVVAVVTGLCGSFMAKIILYMLRWRSRLTKVQAIVYVLTCGVLVAVAGTLVSAHMFGSGKDIMTSLLFSHDKNVPWYLPLLRMAGSVCTFTSGVAGGVFAPALCAGSTFGAMVAGWFHMAATDTNLLILAGMVGFLTGVTRTPFTAAILVLEMTDRHNVIFHLMLAGMIASVVAMIVDKHSMYDHLKADYLHDLRNQPERV